MRAFFKGWRRKAGCVLLVMACALMGMWIRGHAILDTIQFGTGDGAVQQMLILSHYGVNFTRIEALGDSVSLGWTPGWKSKPLNLAIENDKKLDDNWEITWRWAWCGFEFWDLAAVELQGTRRTIPYWAIVAPLTVLSAYLILWKPRKQPRPDHA